MPVYLRSGKSLWKRGTEIIVQFKKAPEVIFRGTPAADRLDAMLSPEQQRLLASLAPERISLPSGRQLKVHYQIGKPPWVESRLQDFFGMERSPAIGGGDVQLVLHLLAPNQRPVQVTSDLKGFWARHYSGIRKELARKYPRHPWPEDPIRASPPAPRPARRP